MSHTVSFTKIINNNLQKTPNVKEIASSSDQCKGASTSSPILMDEFGQTPDHFYLAKTPPSFFQVRRKLDYVQSPLDSSGSKPKTTKQRKRNATKKVQERIPSIKNLSLTYGKTNADRPRYDTSLGSLTKKFLKLLYDAGEDGVMNLNSACLLLSVPKRRLYDITNVLEGAGLVQKTSRNNIQWMGRVSSPAENSYNLQLEKDIDILEAKENQLDELIYHMKAQVKMLRESEEQYHYITADDLKSFFPSKNMVLGMKLAPTDQQIETFRRKLVLTSKSTEMDAFLLSEDAQSFSNILNPQNFSISERKTRKKKLPTSYKIKLSENCVIRAVGVKDEELERSAENYQRIISSYELICGKSPTYSHVYAEAENACTTLPHTESTVSYSEVCAETEDICTTHMPSTPLIDTDDSYSGVCVETTWAEGETIIKNAFISQEDDIAPMGRNFLLQTTDQDLDLFNVIQYSDVEMPADTYSFSLGHGEGVADLFDSNLFS